MRRRGPIRRPFRRAGPQRVPPELRRANELMDAGHHAQAAVAFEQIARRADARRGPRAPHFHLRAGRAYIFAGDTQKGMPHLKQGLAAIAAKKHWEPLQNFGQRAVDELSELGYQTESDEIAAYLAEKLPTGTASPAKARSRPTLPTHCPGCGAPLRTDEVEWIDQKTAECIYCDSPVRGEN
ncbi:MAG: hypothetical protein HN855_05700 [Anaerolineae bacterium]|jgi:hypothetical protein|nr:hypothetical protein [Anaerolineae bacterium]MBT7072756.1 hypothetical protein [Anaerolineae bacterium]MBT7324633.1 hypothetical protein [Anaerolineae bacterium]